MSADSGDLSCLLYVSTATRPLDEAELEALITVSRERNEASNITGLLVYSQEHFLQVLEGPAEAVTETYERIQNDSRHQHVTTMVEEKVDSRFFSDWSMAYQRITEADSVPGPSLEKLLAHKKRGTLKTIKKLFQIFQEDLRSGAD